MEMSVFLEIFEKYGFSGILVAGLGVIIYLLIKKLTSNISKNVSSGMDNLAKSISAQNDKMLDAINKQNDKMINFLMENKNKYKEDQIHSSDLHNKKLKERMHITEFITNKLKDILNYTNAQRVVIIEFHNSNQNLIGIPFAKFSVTYEWIKKKVIPIQNMMNSVPFSIISSVVGDIIKSGESYVVYNDAAKLINSNPTLSYILNGANAKAVIFYAMYDDKNSLLGLLGVEFGSDIPEYVDFNELENDVIEITSILNLNYKYNIQNNGN